MIQAENFGYQGSVITSDGKLVRDIERRGDEAARAFGMLRLRLWRRRVLKSESKNESSHCSSAVNAGVWGNIWGVDRNRRKKI